MRKVLCMMAFLLCMGLPTLAEEAPTLPDWAVGEWKAVLQLDGAQIFIYDQAEFAPRLLITEDGFLTVPEEGTPRFPLLYDAETEDWYVSDPETEEKAFLDWSGYLASPQLIFGADANHLTCYIRANGASPVQLPYKLPAVSCSGDWVVTSLFPWSGTDSKTFFAEFWFDFEGMNTDPLTVTLPSFPTFETIQQVWKDAVSQTADDCPLRALQVYGFELRNESTLLLVTQHGLLTLWRVSSPELDPAFQDKIDDCVGWWYPDEISVGGIYLPASAMGIPDAPIAIDEQGNVLLPDGTVTALRLEEDTLLLGQYPVSGGFSLTLAEDVELDFMSEEAWYRRQLNGDWQLIRIEVPALNTTMPIDPAITDVTLNIDSSSWCYMDSDQYRLYDTYDVTEYSLYPLYGDDAYTLTIASLSTLRVMPEGGSYILTFTRIEETEE